MNAPAFSAGSSYFVFRAALLASCLAILNSFDYSTARLLMASPGFSTLPAAAAASPLIFQPATIGTYTAATSTFKLRSSNTPGPADKIVAFGAPGDMPIVGDWNGDGIETIGVYRNSDGTFHLSNSNVSPHEDIVFTYGGPPYQYQPIAGDWNGDGTDTVGLFSQGGFFLRNSNASGPTDIAFALGVQGDVAVTGDWDGNGIDTCGVFKPSNGALYLKNSNTTGVADIVITYGSPGDKPVTGDWNADGIDTIGVYKTDTFFLRNSNTVGFADIVAAFGAAGDNQIAGNWGPLSTGVPDNFSAARMDPANRNGAPGETSSPAITTGVSRSSDLRGARVWTWGCRLRTTRWCGRNPDHPSASISIGVFRRPGSGSDFQPFNSKRSPLNRAQPRS